MKKLLLFALVLGLFSGCKKDSTPEAPCYVGIWEGSVADPYSASYAATYYDGPPTITLYDNNTGVARFTIKSTAISTYTGNKVGVGFTYTVSTENKFTVTNLISSTLAIGSGEPVTQDKSTTQGFSSLLTAYAGIPMTCQENKLSIVFPPNAGYGNFLLYTDWTRKQ